MSLILIGTSYKQASLELREKLFFSQDEGLVILKQAIAHRLASAGVVVSTCLRSEIYLESTNASKVKDFIFDFKGLDQEHSHYFYLKHDKEAISHLFYLAAGLDSQAIGETEILHQIKQAYFQAQELGLTNSILRRSFERSLFAGKLVRAKTDIAKINPSIAFEAVKKAKELSFGIKNKNIAVIGAGLIAGNIIREVAKEKAKGILVANRTFEHAQKLVRGIEAKAVRFEEFYEEIDKIDILFSATKSKHLILKKEFFLNKRQANKKLIIFDLAFPRDIDPEISGYEGIQLFDLDDFNFLKLSQQGQVLLAKEMIGEKLRRFIGRQDFYERYVAGRYSAEPIGY